MEQVISRAINLINSTLESPSKPCSHSAKSRFITIRNDLNRLLQLDPSKDKWIQLFCRQLQRSIEYKTLSIDECWIELHHDILYILNRSNHKEYEGSSRKNLFQAIQLETKLEQREIEFQQTFGERKGLSELMSNHYGFFTEYLRKCISLHSKLQVQGLVQNVDDLLRNVFGLTDIFLSSESRTSLKEKLNSVQITLDCSRNSLTQLHRTFLKYDNSQRSTNSTLSNFIPSTEKLPLEKFSEIMNIETILAHYRWLVMMGEPGSGKTSLLRWLTCTLAEKVLYRAMQILRKDYDGNSLRVPILIRIGEFTAWLEHYPTKTLIDYIGKHTWFSECYCREDAENLLKELIYNGHALILLDGLDEICDVKRRGEIVDLIRKFIDKYVRTPSFISAFDDEVINIQKPYDWTDEIFSIDSLRTSSANQIIVTSRIVGYQLHSLIHPWIVHCSVLPMNNNEAKQFIHALISEMERNIFEILRREIPEVSRNPFKTTVEKKCKAIENIFENCSQALISTPLMLSSICTHIFQSLNECHFKSRIEIYHYVVQSILRSWTNQKPNISEHTLFNVLMDLAVYLHLQSSSGLIDGFDMEHLCYSTLKKLSRFKNRTQLYNDARELISLLDMNVGIVAEHDLQVFGFSHLTFQEYFVAQSIVSETNSIEIVAKRILAYIMHQRFRESLLFALSWVSWQWTTDGYDKFCSLLLSPNQNYAIPFGTLLFFDAFHDLQRSPSNMVIFKALNSILDHPFDVVATTYFIPNLFKLQEDIIKEWMQADLKDEQRLFKFCCCLLTTTLQSNDKPGNMKSVRPVIYEQLCSLYNINRSAAFTVDQTLRKLMPSYFLPQDASLCNLHPLVISVIIAVCSGIFLENEQDMKKTIFSPNMIRCHSSIIAPIVDYITHKNELQTLIQWYENILEKVLPSDDSPDVVDIFIALLCLQGLSQPLIYQKYSEYHALSLALNKLKQIWVYSEMFFNYTSRLTSAGETSFMISEIESIMNEFFSQQNQSDEQCIAFSLAFAAAWKKLHPDLSLNLTECHIFSTKNIDQYLECQPEFSHLNVKIKVEKMTKNTHPLQMFQHEPCFLITFVQQSLQPLYYCMIVNSINNTDAFTMIPMILSHCLIVLDNANTYDVDFYLAVFMLLPSLKEYMFENYASVLFEQGESIRWPNEAREEFFKAMQDYNFTHQSKDWQILIDIERQRINEAKNKMQGYEKDLCFFAASICLARLLREEPRSCAHLTIESLYVSTIETEDVHRAITSIVDPILRIIALSVILDMKNPFIFHEEQRDQLILEMMNLFESLLSNLSLLMLTLLFVRCYQFCLTFPSKFQHIIHMIDEKLNATLVNEQTEEQEAAFIALRQLDNIDLESQLAAFTRRNKNLSNLLHFNSTIFYDYFTNKNAFNPTNTILLSSMYLTELAFDAQILKMYTNNDIKIDVFPQNKVEQLCKGSSEFSKLMTFEVATGITNYLKQITNKTESHEIIENINHYSLVERKAVPVIEKWLHYRMDKDLRYFAYYAALVLVKEGSGIPNLIEIINEGIMNDNEFHLKYLLQSLFYLRHVNRTEFRQIFVALNKNIGYSAQISVHINNEEILELLLSLELERITSNTNDISQPYLLMVTGCSVYLEVYLKKHLLDFINTENTLQHNTRDEYLAIIIKWILEMSIALYSVTKFSIDLYEWIFTFLYELKFTRVHKAILNALNSIFLYEFRLRGQDFTQNETIIHLENIIYAWERYPKDTLSLCLLAYGNYILKSQALKRNRDYSEGIKSVLTTIFETSSSEFISIRAAFCLIYIHNSNITSYNTIWNWFENKQNITPKQRYIIQFQLTLYGKLNLLLRLDTDMITQLIDIFVSDFYNYLLNKENIDYLTDPTPNYVDLALEFCETHCDVFRSAIDNSSFGDEKFREQYKTYYYQTKNPKQRKTLVHFYAVFDGVTYDLIDMIKWIDSIEKNDGIAEYGHRYVETGNGWKYLDHIKYIADRNIIEIIFQSFDSTWHEKKSKSFLSILKLLVQLAQKNVVSMLELHEHICSLFNNIPFQNTKTWPWNDTKTIFDLLLNLSCIKKLPFPDTQVTLFTESDIEEKFKEKIQHLSNKSTLFLRRNYFFIFFRSINLR